MLQDLSHGTTRADLALQTAEDAHTAKLSDVHTLSLLQAQTSLWYT